MCENVISWLQAITAAAEKFECFGGTIEKFILENGREFPTRIDLPHGVTYGKAKECFGNAFALAAYDDRFTYVEGYAYTPGLISVHHAWIIDADGNVIDNTWRDGGTECAFCDGDKQVIVNVCSTHEISNEICGCDEEEVGYEDELDCEYCEGTGENRDGTGKTYQHPSREGTEYFGIAVDKDTLIKTVLKKGTYGVLDSEEFLDSIKEAV